MAAGAAWLLSSQFEESADTMAEGIGEDVTSADEPGEDDVVT